MTARWLGSRHQTTALQTVLQLLAVINISCDSVSETIGHWLQSGGVDVANHKPH